MPEGGERREPEAELQEALLIGWLEDTFMHREVEGVSSSWLPVRLVLRLLGATSGVH